MKKIGKKIINVFLQGLLYTVPLFITVYIIVQIFIFIDGILPFKDIPGLGIVIIFVFITLVGFIGNTMIGRPIISYFTKIIDKAPLIKDIYSALKDLVSAFVGKKKRFSEPVLVKMGNGLEKIGFITNKDLKEFGIGEEKIAVYLPYSYGVMGSLYIVAKENITTIDASSTNIMKFIVSGGIINIDKIEKQ